VKYTNEFGDIDEYFYEDIEIMYEEGLEFIMNNELKEEFKERCEKITINTRNIGWGFHDNLVSTFKSYFRKQK